MASDLVLPDVEQVAARVHEEWMNTKRSQGVTSRKSETGEELMVDYTKLSEPAKDLDRNTVKAVYRAIQTLLMFLLLLWTPTAAGAQSLPLWDPSQLQYEGTVTYDWQDGAGGDFSYGGSALGVSEDGQYLYVSCNPATPSRGIGKLKLGPVGTRLTVVSPCKGPTEADIKKIQPTGWNAGAPSIGGVLEQGGRIAVSVYGSYDANDVAVASHFVGADLDHLQGPFRGQVRPGLIKGSMGVIPPEWRAALGGPAFAVSDYTSIISRGSYGLAFTVLDLATMAQDQFPSTLLVGCPHSNPACRTWTAWGPSSNGFEGPELAGGTFIVPGTSTLIAVEREATGFPAGPGVASCGSAQCECYGYRTDNPDLHGAPYTVNPAEGVRWCYAPWDPHNQKGNKAGTPRIVAKLYNLNHVVAVKQGQMLPEQVKPYAVVDFPSEAGKFVTQGAFNPVTGRLYVLEHSVGGMNTLKVYKGFGPGSAPPPPPPDEICGDGIDNDGDGLVDEGCVPPPPPPPPNLTLITAINQCRVTVQNSPPDNTGGWGVQFRYNQSNFGRRDTSAPFERTRNFGPGTYVLSGVWTKSGQPDVLIPPTTFTVATDCK